MRIVCSVSTTRHAEARAGVAESVLMQRAATGLALVAMELVRARAGRVRGTRVVGLVGSGNNGGDALWGLARLAGRGVHATAVGDPHRMHAGGARAARAAGVQVLGWSDPRTPAVLGAADLAIDGIVGIGASGGLREPAAGAVRILAVAGVPVLAVDVPSGVDVDSGLVGGDAVRALATVTFGVLKACHVLAPAKEHAGAVTVLDIGLRAADLVPLALVASLPDLAVPAPEPATHKYRRGVVGVTAGSRAYPGAAVLAVGGARQAGAGMVVLTPGPHDTADAVGRSVLARFPDVVLGTERDVDARCVGPGLGDGPSVASVVLAALAGAAPVVVDASALTVLAGPRGRDALAVRTANGRITVVTPHAGEFARLGSWTDGAGSLRVAQQAADELGVIVVLKGPGTVVAAPGVTPQVDVFGDSALATAGSGDVLAGMIAGMLAGPARSGELDIAAAARLAARAVGLHGLAGRLAAARGGQVSALDVLDALPEAHRSARAGTG